MTRATETAEIIHKHLEPLPKESCELIREGAPVPPDPPSETWNPDPKSVGTSSQFFLVGWKHRVGGMECLCLYSLLLPLCWWMTNSVPRCVAALAPFVTLPVLRTLGADEAAAAFLTQALPLFLWLTALTYAMSLFVPKAAVALLLNLAVDKILTCIHDCELDRTLSEQEEQRYTGTRCTLSLHFL
ncbi:hypothetical protein V5799_008650 [Amblyomma americanum]|uniref:Uncharacterized protein n=1 Tax=Amblyomma americanum TaxID=6943 RepID=A0AAQ4FE41_AMBAM